MQFCCRYQIAERSVQESGCVKPDNKGERTKVKQRYSSFPIILLQFNQYRYYKYSSNGTDVSHFTEVDAHATI